MRRPKLTLPSPLLLVLATAQAMLLLVTAWRTGPGWDEWGHLPSGLYTLQFCDHHPYQVNPPLIRVIAAVPVAAMGGAIEHQVLSTAPGFRSEGLLGMAYIHQQGEDVFYWMSVARTAVIPVAIFGTFLLERVVRRFAGRQAGLFAASLWAFSPTVLAFGGTITPDVAATVFGFWAAWCFWCWYRIGGTRDAVWLGISVAAALLSKTTWILLPLIFLALFCFLRYTVRSRAPVGRHCLQIGGAATLAWILIHAAYDFQGMLRPLGSFAFISETLSGNGNLSLGNTPVTGNRFQETVLGYLPAPLPANYIQGIDVQKRDFESKSMASYLMGTWSNRGWWYYYGVAWLLKEPLAFWLILMTGWVAVFRLRVPVPWGKRIGSTVMAIPGLVVFLFVSSQTGFNHHLRYVLPAFPAAMMIAALPMGRIPPALRRVMLVLVIWFAASSIAMVPRSYAFFSEVVGGWRYGHRYLNNSNLDWGQDLLAIRQWVRENPDKRPIYLIYSPAQLDFKRLGIDATAGGSVSQDGPEQDGWWIVSIDSMLAGSNSWFLGQPVTERISVSSTVYHVDGGEVVNQ